MMRAATIVLTTLFATSCAEEAAGTLPAVDVTVEEDHAEKVFGWLEGSFDSSKQASEDPEFYAVSLKTCEVAAPFLGDLVLYVEQALTSSLEQPYRQRLYSVSLEDDAVVSRVYAFSEAVEADLVGACADPSSVELSEGDVEVRDGCAVWLVPSDGGLYSGGTVGNGCTSNLGDAAYATSEVVLGPTSISSWDRGWTAEGEQAWGAVTGPYVFERL